MRKIDPCFLLRMIAQKLEPVADLIFGHMHRAVIKALETAQCDRVLKVRQMAIQAKQAWLKVGTISKEVEERKQNVELEGLTPDELIKARTGYGDIQEVRQSIMDEMTGQRTLSPPGPGQSQRVMRPLTAESNSLKRDSTPQKKFKMLKELARLNQELRVQKPYAPKDQEKRLMEDKAWSSHARG